uniref:Uncharacterized protein n=1 Tax=Chromera velia CCMP2878 TaxID=1169474 RepID=A0A0G4I575_9ALVE|mmetsp:Transcript_53724/g.105062  ORF Transcript_53724/g.105062 Transcript_53724/m.105062 type:complete len:165 (+) Transcript_53724:705-1199(+)|eukprot:Cvel_11114.t1-p1 / transcript=Cvel_11114.t1 / gene=Cvel_11114 / organism=Chromera_velia_CCMP2878 / gene_product=hypothetical protein / transcript_product=hypothetical protein / location=Cvel_scaffold688:22890-23381(-) / protein_length=164 / sequence_SO=supercontig / SO=protein_coding / is_pseudo=false
MLVLRRAWEMEEVHHPGGKGIGSFVYPLNLGGIYEYQLEVTLPPGLRIHIFAVESSASWCFHSSPQFGVHPVTLQYAYILPPGKEPMPHAQEVELHKEMRANLLEQLRWCWGAFASVGCECVPSTPRSTSFFLGTCTPDSRNTMFCPQPLFPPHASEVLRLAEM